LGSESDLRRSEGDHSGAVIGHAVIGRAAENVKEGKAIER
jgi:hypothetical protein